MRKAVAKITGHLLLSALHLPANTEILDAWVEESTGDVYFTISHPDIKKAKTGDGLPLVTPLYRSYGLIPTEDVEFLGWEQ